MDNIKENSVMYVNENSPLSGPTGVNGVPDSQKEQESSCGHAPFPLHDFYLTENTLWCMTDHPTPMNWKRVFFIAATNEPCAFVLFFRYGASISDFCNEGWGWVKIDSKFVNK